MRADPKSILKFAFIGMAFFTIASTFVMCSQKNAPEPIDIDAVELVQFDQPEEGDEIAIITTNLGVIKAVLYEEYAPNTVANFVSLAQSGYYDGTYFAPIEPDVYSIGGGPNENGDLNEDFKDENEEIENEYHNNLWPFKGAFCSISSKEGLGGSRFMVLNSIEFDEETKKAMLEVNENTKIADKFIEFGGIPNFSRKYTIFAQTYEGFDVIEKIVNSELKSEDERIPSENITIESVKIEQFS